MYIIHEWYLIYNLALLSQVISQPFVARTPTNHARVPYEAFCLWPCLSVPFSLSPKICMQYRRRSLHLSVWTTQRISTVSLCPVRKIARRWSRAQTSDGLALLRTRIPLRQCPMADWWFPWRNSTPQCLSSKSFGCTLQRYPVREAFGGRCPC